jgi:tRNA (mo5U34)-methyltransferase
MFSDYRLSTPVHLPPREQGGRLSGSHQSPEVPGSVQQLLEYAVEFEGRLAAAKSAPPNDVFQWYPYHTIGSLAHLAPLLEKYFAEFQAGLGGKILDIGCGDGDLSYFFASMGCRITAVDLPISNFNWMTGVRTLRTRLDLPVDIREMDLDSQFALEDGPYGLALLLGTLYHLKNPFYILETLAQRAVYCLLSTRVAGRSVAGTPIREEPLAYLLDSREANNDPTNYWIFSHQGLLRLVKRAGWKVLAWRSIGCTTDSNPADSRADERMFLFLRSQFCSAPAQVTLREGWLQPEAQNWAWTEKKFGLEVRLEEGWRLTSFRLAFVVPEAMARASTVSLACKVNGHAAGMEVFHGTGEKFFERPMPQAVDQTRPMIFEFSVEHNFVARPDPRDLGIIVPFTGVVRGINSPILFWLS